MKDHPILFTSDMVRAVMTCAQCATVTLEIECPKCGSKERRKTHTRRVLKRQPPKGYDYRGDDGGNPLLPKDSGHYWTNGYAMWRPRLSPYGIPGDLLWVRGNTRTVCYGRGPDFAYGEFCIEYLADKQLVKCPDEHEDWWRRQWHIRPGTTLPSIFMPKWACRLWLKVKAVRVERVQEITEDDAILEGVTGGGVHPDFWVGAFHDLWDSINAKRDYGWDTNPWVRVIEFERHNK